MGLPIYQIQMYKKAPPITKHTKITQEICKLVLAIEKYLKSLKKVKGMLLKVTNIVTGHHFQYNLKEFSFYAYP